ncbi:MAG: hypothetical protein UT41_C0001G0448 [Candidatus Wolfebacteria bacterium GW2011_GWC2_39_22]|uniref:Nudix hydrolase domain-containing protein n=2 Tax=Candidatus Wolfeibacteriota TaxID=1752735 RepID=A0A0G1HAM6_9BACT|nr:MAG: hypothetical protein UT41_C0001G0448 [Candidatus Wolfebacteria bacterium GW2011_GWC2_39_22]KKT43835.1 MAG: hypothetical protein UW32_C0001G0427 [Candidatus Wolfebacteria bacterium GW2011_GWE2_44_13]HBI25438.1 hypothetical protein [Candidatus Wolfebacteria bacterium]
MERPAATVVFVEVNNPRGGCYGIVVIRDKSKPNPILCKFPGGHVEEGETRKKCAEREVFEEIGIRVDPSKLEEIAVVHKWNHDLVFFRVTVDSIAGIHPQRNKGEEVMILDPQEVLERNDFLSTHRRPYLKRLKELAMAA